MKFTIKPVSSGDELAEIAMLFSEYAVGLPIDLAYQNFAWELASLPGAYAPPRGVLFLAQSETDDIIGCVALRESSSERCAEMKRLYLRPHARGLGLGRALTEAIIKMARHLEYDELRLDTLASMSAATHLYKTMGFSEISPYYSPTPPETVFMSLRLASD